MPRSSLVQLRQQIARLETQAKKLEETEGTRKRKAVTEVRALMRKLGVELADLQASDSPKTARAAASKPKREKSARPPVPVKYRNSETGDTWTGRGRTPRWLAALEAAGRTRDEFKIG
ncbi:MAG: H-NS histone family protein [Burkholderiales bacterium]|nr:H-NS histone family protein [Burkholderiales bacterium]